MSPRMGESLLARHSWQSKGEVLNDIARGIDFQFVYNASTSMTTELQSHCSSSGNSSARSRSTLLNDIAIDAPFTSTLRNLAEQVEGGSSGLVARPSDRAVSGRSPRCRSTGRPVAPDRLREKQMPSAPTGDTLVNISRYVLPPPDRPEKRKHSLHVSIESLPLLLRRP